MIEPYYFPQPQSQDSLGFTPNNQQFGSSNQFNVSSGMQPFPLQDQAQELGEYRTRFSGFLSGLETPEQTRSRYENRYGYQDLTNEYNRTQELMSGVGNQIKATPENVQQRVNRSGTIVNQGQMANVQNSEVADLMETYTSLGQINEQQGRRLAQIETNMNTASQLEMAQQQKMMTPWLQEYQDTNILQARQQTNWTFANQLELNRLLANQSAGLQWTNAEASRANQLSMQENAFNNSLKFLEKQSEYSLDAWGI